MTANALGHAFARKVRNGSQRHRRNRLYGLLLGALSVIGSDKLQARVFGEATDPNAPLVLKLSRSLGDTRSVRVGSVLRVRELKEARLKVTLTLAFQDILTRSAAKGARQNFMRPGVSLRSADSAIPHTGNRLRALDGVEVRWPLHGLANQAEATQQPETPVPFDPKPTGTVQRPGGQQRSERPVGSVANQELPDIEGESWQLAPIRWIGTTTTSSNYFLPEGSGKSLTIFNNLNVQASSFIVAPYIAQWTGSFGASSSSTSTTPVNGSDIKSEGSSLNFGGSVNVFPLSRFPFSASISRATSESRTAGSAIPSTSLTLGLRQNYRTEDGRDNYSLNFNRNTVSTGTGSGAPTSVVSSFGGGYSTNREFDYEHWLEGSHNVSANFNMSSALANQAAQVSTNSGPDSSRFFNASLTHGWNVHEDLNFNNLLTFASTEASVFQGNALTQNSSSVVAGSTGVTWRPIEELPLTLIGSGNFSRTTTINNNRQNEQSNLGAYVSTNYRFNENLSAGGNVSISSTAAGTSGQRNTSSTQSANLSYSGDPLDFAGFTYGWGAGGGFSRNSSSSSGSQIGTTLSASHNLSRTLLFERIGAINLTGAQSVSLSNSSSGAITNLSNTAGMGWRATYGKRLSANLNGNLIVSMSGGASGTNQFRSANLSGAGAYQISSSASLNVSANLIWSQSLIDNSKSQVLNGVTFDSNAPVASGSFSVAYSHQSPFSIRNLNYNGSFTRSQSFSNLNVAGGSTPSATNNASNSLQQLVDYRVGRLIFRLNHAWIDQAGRKSASIFGSVTREFDGFFDGRW